MKRLSARLALTALLLAVLATVSTVVAVNLIGLGERIAAAREQHRAERILVHIVRGAQHLAFERGRTNVVLRANAPISEENRAFIDGRRSLADNEFDTAIHLLNEENTILARRLSRQQQMLGDLRGRADSLLALPMAERDPLFANQWFNSLTAMLEGVPESVFMLGGDGQSLPPLARVSLHAFDLRNALGVESSRIAAALGAGKPPDAGQMQELARLRGQGDAAWASLRREAVQSGNAAVAEAVAQVEKEVFRNFRPLQDAVLSAFVGNRLPRETMPHYTNSSVPALDSVAKVMDVAAQEGMALAEAEEKAVWREFAVQVFLLALCVAATGATLLVSRHLLARLQTLRQFMYDPENAPSPPATDFDETAEIAQMAVSLRDNLVERRRVEAELEDVSKLNRMILDHASDGMVALDSRGVTVFANPAAQAMTGWTMAEMEGRSHHAMIHHSLVDGTPNPVAECPVHLTLADGRSRRVAEDLFWRKDGTCFPVELGINCWGEGKERGVVLVFRDISDRKGADERSQMLMEELQRSNAELENFAYAVSHDLQAPLRTVSSFVVLSRRALADRLDATTTEYMDMAEQGAKRMSAMISALLDYARIGSRGEPPGPVALAPLVARVVTDLGPMVSERNARIEVVEPLPTVVADSTQLGSVVQNLLTNALKYAGTETAPRIRVIGWSHGGTAGFAVEDNGPGIPAEQRQLLFGLFKRGGTHPDIPGLGMGLAICRRVVERLGGTIRAEDNPGGGARFVVTLPNAPGRVEGTGVTT